MASLALGGMAEARASPLSAATPISRADAANRCRRRKAIALASLTSRSLFTIDLSLSDGERAEAHSSLAGEEARLDAVSDGAASLRRSGPTSVLGPGSPCRPSRVSETANYDAGPQAVVAGALRAHPARGRQVTPVFRMLQPVPSGLFLAGHVPNSRPRRRAGYVMDLYSQICYHCKCTHSAFRHRKTAQN